MSPTLLYLLKANVALLLFAAAYVGLLRRLTFFQLNCVYLLFALVFSAAYPALPLPALFPAEAAMPVLISVPATTAVATGTTAAPSAAPVDWAAVGLLLYAGGVALLLSRLLMQLLSLARVRRASRPAVVRGQAVRTLAGAVSPFSFWQTIYLNPAQHPAAELAAVLRHEQVHVRQWHTLDVLLAQLALAAAWCNPAAWLLRRAVLDNLEYLADHAVLQTGLMDRQDYQYSLLRLSQAATGPTLVSPFTFPTLKNRVAMMNTPFSSTGQLARYFVAGPLVLAVALGFSAAQVQAQGAGSAPAKGVATTIAPVAPAPAGATMPSAVRAYLDKYYPQAELASWSPLQERNSIAPGFQYMAVIIEDGQRQQLYFDATGQPALVGSRKQQSSPPKGSSKVTTVKLKSFPEAKGSPAQRNGPPPVYYVDGKVNNEVMSTITPDAIASIDVFKGENALKMAGPAGATGVIAITTKLGQDQPEVRAFNEKYGVSSPPPVAAEQPKSVPYLAAPALAYITKNHPEARLLGVTEVKAPDGDTPRYQAEIVIGRRPGYVLFDGQGEFISEAHTPYVR